MFNAILSGKKVRDKSAAVLYREEACAESDQCQYEANYKPNYDGDDYCYDAYSECFQPATVKEVLYQSQPNNQQYKVSDQGRQQCIEDVGEEVV